MHNIQIERAYWRPSQYRRDASDNQVLRLMPSQRFEDREYRVLLHSCFAPRARNPQTPPVAPAAPPASTTTSIESTSHPLRRCLQASYCTDPPPAYQIPSSSNFPNAINILRRKAFLRTLHWKQEGKTVSDGSRSPGVRFRDWLRSALFANGPAAWPLKTA